MDKSSQLFKKLLSAALVFFSLLVQRYTSSIVNFLYLIDSLSIGYWFNWIVIFHLPSYRQENIKDINTLLSLGCAWISAQSQRRGVLKHVCVVVATGVGGWASV